MALTRDRMLDRMLASDPSYDGRFLTGVLSTGIFCLPSCRARKPKPENVRFFRSPEDASAAGLRPCKRCRPDFFYRRRDPDREGLAAAVAALRADPGEVAGVAELAAAVEVGVSKLGELCRRHYHASPAELIAEARVERARRELLTGRRSTTDVAFEVGFASLSAFHEQFRRRAGLAPSEFRRLAERDRFAIELPPRFPAALVLGHLGRDRASVSERVDGTTAAVAARLDGRPAVVVIEVGPRRALVRVEGSGPLSAAAAGDAHRLVRRLLGLAVDPRPFERRAAGEPDVARLVAGRRGLGIPQTRDPWDALIWVVAGQQVHLGLAFAMRRRLVERLGVPAGDRAAGLRVPPEPAAVAAVEPAEIVALGWSRAKADYLVGAARAIASGELDLDALATATVPEAEARLSAVRGLGPWSVHYLLMRAYGFRDCLPAGDVGLARALERFDRLETRPDTAAITVRMAAFAPFRSLATFHFWTSLQDSEENPAP